MDNQEDDEFIEDFGAPAITDAQLDDLLARARTTGDVTLRRLIKQFQALRSTTNAVLQHVDACESAEQIKNAPYWEWLRMFARQRA